MDLDARKFSVVLDGAVLLLLAIAALLPLKYGVPGEQLSDPFGTSVVAQNLLSTGHLSLSGLAAAFFRNPDGTFHYQVLPIDGRLEYYFPLGPVIAALPVVAISNAVGVSALTHDLLMQEILVFISSVLILGLTYSIARLGWNRAASLALALLAYFGTVIGPTVGSAFWSINGEIAVAGSVFLLLRLQAGRGVGSGVALGILLFVGFLFRPTFASVIVCVFAYLAVENRRMLAGAALSSALLLVALVAFSEHHYGRYLPPYYLASRLSFEHAPTAFWGLLASPSRSVFVFSPVLLALPCLAMPVIRFSRSLRIAVSAAMALQFLSNVFFWQWWGGWSYGPRILCCMSYLGCVAVLSAIGSLERHRRPLAITVFGLLAVGAVVNLPGSFDEYTRLWSARPSVDDYPAAIFDWRYPQFLAVTASAVRSKCRAQEPRLAHDIRAFCDIIPDGL